MLLLEGNAFVLSFIFILSCLCSFQLNRTLHLGVYFVQGISVLWWEWALVVPGSGFFGLNRTEFAFNSSAAHTEYWGCCCQHASLLAIHFLNRTTTTKPSMKQMKMIFLHCKKTTTTQHQRKQTIKEVNGIVNSKHNTLTRNSLPVVITWQASRAASVSRWRRVSLRCYTRYTEYLQEELCKDSCNKSFSSQCLIACHRTRV